MTESTVRIGLFHLIISGLPYSGKTTLLKSMIEPKLLRHDDMLNLCETVINESLLSGHVWKEAPKPEAGVNFLLFAFAHFFVRHHKLPKFDKQASFFKIYEDVEVQNYFESAYNDLQKVLLHFDSEKDLQEQLSQSLNLVNVYDIGVNKAVYEFLMAIGGRNRNFFLINVINMFKYNENESQKLMDLSKYYYEYSENELNFYKSHSAMQYFAAQLRAAAMNGLKKNTVIVGTHADEFVEESSSMMKNDKIEERRKVLMHLIESCAKDYDVDSSLVSEMTAVDARSPQDCERVKCALIDLINISKKDVEIDLPVSFIFLRCVLSNTKQIFISREHLTNYAKKCLVSEDKIDSFLDFFRKCGSIISSDNPTEFLYDYFILLPCDFLRDLNKLYCVHTNDSIPQDIKEGAKHGFVSDKLLRSLWQGMSGSEGSMLLSDVYSKVLQNVHMITEIDEGRYFMPSLRNKYCELVPKSDSLIIETNLSFIRFNSQCTFTKYFTTKLSEFVQIAECDCFNVAAFKWKEPGEKELEVKIKIHQNYVEVALSPMPTTSGTKKYITNAIGRVKTACVNAMKEYMSDLDFQLAVICPNSPKEKPHFVNFKICPKSFDNGLQCQKCDCILGNEDPRMLWVQIAFEGDALTVMDKNDVLSPSNLLHISNTISSVPSFSADKIQVLAKKMALNDIISTASSKSVSDVLFDLLYKWHNLDSSLTKDDIIQVLEECELYQEAANLGSTTLIAKKSEVKTTLTSKQLHLVISNWQQDSKRLARILKINTSVLGQSFKAATDNDIKCLDILSKWLEQQDGDIRRKLATIMENEGYFSLSEVILSISNDKSTLTS